MLGVELGGSVVQYDQAHTNSVYADAYQWNAGLYFESVASPYLKFRGSAGYTVYTPNTVPQTNDFSGMYGQLGLVHRLNKYVDYGLSGGRSINFGFFGGTIDLYSVRWQANWHIIRDIGLSTSFTYENGTEIFSTLEKFERYGPGLTLSRNFTKKLSASLSYQFYNRNSNLADRSYILNIVTLTIGYQF